ncbi:hypothetical protein PLANTIT3_50501 [Plantibacter sp. T3]|nr:hypothetical protein PLANTIT3_50501 [Plantibacter sp. T3]
MEHRDHGAAVRRSKLNWRSQETDDEAHSHQPRAYPHMLNPLAHMKYLSISQSATDNSIGQGPVTVEESAPVRSRQADIQPPVEGRVRRAATAPRRG